jgi:hypothetical protein
VESGGRAAVCVTQTVGSISLLTVFAYLRACLQFLEQVERMVCEDIFSEACSSSGVHLVHPFTVLHGRYENGCQNGTRSKQYDGDNGHRKAHNIAGGALREFELQFHGTLVRTLASLSRLHESFLCVLEEIAGPSP